MIAVCSDGWIVTRHCDGGGKVGLGRGVDGVERAAGCDHIAHFHMQIDASGLVTRCSGRARNATKSPSINLADHTAWPIMPDGLAQ